MPCPVSSGRSLTAAASPMGRLPASRPALFMAISRPRRSYQGPSPTRSMACTGCPSGPLHDAEERAPGLVAEADVAGDGLADLVGALEAAGGPEAQVAAEAVLALGQPAHGIEAGVEEAELLGRCRPPARAVPPASPPAPPLPRAAGCRRRCRRATAGAARAVPPAAAARAAGRCRRAAAGAAAAAAGAARRWSCRRCRRRWPLPPLPPALEVPPLPPRPALPPVPPRPPDATGAAAAASCRRRPAGEACPATQPSRDEASAGAQEQGQSVHAHVDHP